ncbi:hypothetical protein MYCTH_2309112 [Thermothelomyces thermophilus ATCC 42464]|uniref:VOC domain-containing protein n=1 Tax=Thermothelomyces thermophilus (strain ATCC 42464 / BCRC 31852 / DSM 1799) TaxID=573729 RepID=G2QHZ3_THET4|nr:uncharacterized protein MYCTH_2309112 [Thermothelomyces thermophilus ATCC 42464]AEO60182.1 hypothetical protein MYCTH_2309112 [Thermothelomyces thermophilus ATCC 42464]
MLPFLEVDHLPSSSSFYSAVIQPLGLRYHSTDDGHFPSITFGDSSRTTPIFQIRQVVSSRDRPLRTSRIVLSAPSAAAADSCYEFALRANPDIRESHSRHPAENYVVRSGVSAQRRDTSGGGTRVFITDFVGNLLEVVYQPPPEYCSHYAGSTARYTKSTSEGASRVLSWNYDVATSSLLASAAALSPASSASGRTLSRRSHARYPEDDDDQPHPGIRRSVTTGSSVYEPATSARENSRGLSAGAVVGTLLGVAAGAALGGAFTYNMVKDDRARDSRQDYDMPPSSRRYTFPERYEGYSDRKPRYVEVERAVDRVRYQGDYPTYPDYRPPPPEYIARYSQADAPRTTEVGDVYDDDSRGRHRSSRSRTSSARPRSESASYRDPYYSEMDTEHRSYVSSRSSRHPPIVQRSYTYDTPDRESYVSARSRRSSSTVRAPPAEPYDAPAHVSSHSRSGSRVTTVTYKVSAAPRNRSREGSYVSAHHVPLPDSRAPTYISARDVPLPDSRAPTYVSARHVPLPDSRAPTYVSARDVPLPASRPATYVSARHVPLPVSRVGKWETEDDDDEDIGDTDSIAPSDSISCVGSRRNGR